jgi:hypothetical protein
MKNKIIKPSFEEVGNIINLKDVGLSFNAKIVGPDKFSALREEYSYEKGFKMATIPELTNLVYASLENPNYKTAQEVIKRIKHSFGISGNTSVLYAPDQGIYVQDNPIIENGKIFMCEDNLEKQLGSIEENGVVFSDDRTIRFTPNGSKFGYQGSDDLAKNSGIIALVNGQENAEKLAKSTDYFKFHNFLGSLQSLNMRRVRAVGFNQFGHNLYSRSSADRHSFGVKKIKGESN